MKQLVLILGLTAALGLSSMAAAEPSQGADAGNRNSVVGRYKALGTYIPSNVVYQADVTIIKQGEVYRVEWTSGPKSWTGVGLIEDNRLVVATNGLDGKNLAIISYRVLATDTGMRLVGRWAYPADRVISTETLEPVR